jgi:hypothetical protein
LGYSCIGRGKVCEVSDDFYNEVAIRVSEYKNNVTRWYRQFVETRYLCKGRSPGRPRVSHDNIEILSEVIQRSPRNSVSRASKELGMPRMTVWKVLHKQQCSKPYKMQFVHALHQQTK